MQDKNDIPMERLAAAMAKARSQRSKGASGPRHGGRAPASEPVVAAWGALPPLEVTPRTISRSRLSALQGPAASSDFDVLRTRVLRAMNENGWTQLAVTSADAGSGKTTVSANLALSMARRPELRVVLMDFDLRRPALARLFGYGGAGELADLLSGRVEFSDFAMRYGDNLAICFNSHPVAHSAELLQGHHVAELLEEIAAHWQPDVVVFDMPPLMGSADTLSFVGNVDGVLLVAAAEKTTVSQVDVSERELAAATNVIGTVLTKCRYPDADAGHEGGYY